MPTQRRRRRVRNIIASLAGFPPEGIDEPFKLTPLRWTQRFPFGTGGENVEVPGDSLQPDEAVRIQGFKINPDGVEPAWGYSEIGTPKVSPLEILEINNYKELDGTARLIRLDEDDLQHWNGSSWSTVTGGGDAMTGDQTDPIQSAMVINKFIWVNGVDAPKTWAVGDANYSDLTADVNAPATARYITAFADRVVFADIGTGANRDTQRLDWSASGDPTDFTSTGSGGANLYDSAADAPADDITGLEVVGGFLVVIRRNSVWVGQRTGVATSPLQFRSHSQGYGTDAPGSVASLGTSGVAFLGDDNVYLFKPTMREPLPIGTPVRARIFDDVLDETNIVNVTGTYVPSTQEYWLFVPAVGETWPTRAFVFDVERFRTEERLVWYERVMSDSITAAHGGQTAGLGATYTKRDQNLLIGTDLGETFESKSDETADDGATFTAEFHSPMFTAGKDFLDLKRVNIAYSAGSSSVVTVDFSVDGGDTWTDSAAYTLSANSAVSEIGVWVPPGIYDRTVQFRVRVVSDQDIDLIGYRIAFVTHGEIRSQ